MEQKVTDYTTNPPEERPLTIQEELLIKHMKTISYQQRLLDKIEYLEDRINKLEQTIEELTGTSVWMNYNDSTEELTDKFFK